MREIVRSNDAVLLNFITVLLRDAGINPLLADEHISVMEGSIGALPRRILIRSEDLAAAKSLTDNFA